MKKILLTTLLLLFAFVSKAEGGTFDFFQGGNELVKEYSIYPNPSTGVVTIQIEAKDQPLPLKLKVYSLIGQELHSVNLLPFQGKQELELNLTSFPKGIYMVEISNGDHSKTKRISII